MAKFGDIERFLADLYPYRWPILIILLLIVTAVAALGYSRGWHLALWRRRAGVAIVGTPGLAVLIAVGWWLGSPLFTSTTVDEAFPFSEAAVVPDSMSRAGVEMVMAEMAKLDQPVDEAMPHMAAKDSSPTASPNTSSPPEPVVLSTGSFRDADSFHKGSGIAKIFQSPDGTYLLRLEDLKVTNGPDLHVILSPTPNPESSEQVKTAGYVDLGKLKGNMGNQNYPIPFDVDIDSQRSVVIYCDPFEVVFSVATLDASGG